MALQSKSHNVVLVLLVIVFAGSDMKLIFHRCTMQTLLEVLKLIGIKFYFPYAAVSGTRKEFVL